MKITVAICTWNRAALLDRTLDQFERASLPGGVGWEIVVVNNNCTDRTDEVLARHAGRLPIVRCFEPEAGHSRARNAAVGAATGDYILWTDDDVLVEEGWIAAYVDAFRLHPEAAVFGGPILPSFEPAAPQWLLDALPKVAGALSLRDLGPESLPLAVDRPPFGANFAVRMTEQKDQPYPVSLGNRRDIPVGGEDTSLIRGLLGRGFKGWWVPNARVRHIIPDYRQTPSFLCRTVFWQGFGYRIGAPDTIAGRTAHAIRLLPRIAWAGTRLSWRCCVRPRSEWIADALRLARLGGEFRGAIRPAGPVSMQREDDIASP